jgi:hypothetical protein
MVLLKGYDCHSQGLNKRLLCLAQCETLFTKVGMCIYRLLQCQYALDCFLLSKSNYAEQQSVMHVRHGYLLWFFSLQYREV